jgi:hypothetical protein
VQQFGSHYVSGFTGGRIVSRQNGSAQACRSRDMSVTPKNFPPELSVLGCIIALVLIAFAAIRLTGNSLDARAQAVSESTVGTAAGISTPGPKERVRYQATIENWRRYRAANPP